VSPAAAGPTVSVLVPVTGASGELAAVHAEACRALDALGTDYELIYLVQAERGELLERVRELQRGSPGRVRVLEFAQAVGESAMLRAGAERARGDVLFTLPSEFSVDLSVLARLHAALRGGCDLAFASRTRPGWQGGPHLQSHLFNRLLSWASGTSYRDIAGGTRALRRQVMAEIPLYGDFHRYLPILAERLGFRVEEIAAPLHPKAKTTRFHRPGLYLWRFLDALAVMFVSRFTRRPLRLFGGLGAAFGGVGFVILLVIGIERLAGRPLSDRPALVLATLLLGLGVQAFAIGLLGELILFFRARSIRDYRIAAVYEASPPPLRDPARADEDPAAGARREELGAVAHGAA
jgi:hypothetical protein